MSRHLRSVGPHAAQLSSVSTFEVLNAPFYSLRLTPFLSNRSALFRSCHQNRVFSALCFQAVAHSLKMCIPATPFASATSALFAKNTGVRGSPLFSVSATFGRSDLPSSRPLSPSPRSNTLLDLRSHPRQYRCCKTWQPLSLSVRLTVVKSVGSPMGVTHDA